MHISEITHQLQPILPELRRDYSVATLSIFGSYVRDEQRVDSDLDLLVTFHEVPGLLQFVELENKLSDLLGIKVDLVMRDSLKPAIGERILHEAVAL
ncbi:MAG: nucleotidyltransferase family protein [Caldilineaceae bacterium]|nr:nucleotidyltransferase family protein [Caldilineaceae bacterium]